MKFGDISDKLPTFDLIMISKNIPNTITLLNLALGFVAILVNDPIISPLLILGASALDLFDGLLARVLNARSPLGEQLDSLADLVSFGVAPAYLYYHVLMEPGLSSILIITLVPVAGALRLAIFNTSEGQENSFKGLPVPPAGMFLAFLVFLISTSQESQVFMTYVIMFFPLIVAFLMLSKLRMISLKKIGSKPKPEQVFIAILGIGSLILFSIYLWGGISLAVVLYVLLSLVYSLFFTGKAVSPA